MGTRSSTDHTELRYCLCLMNILSRNPPPTPCFPYSYSGLPQRLLQHRLLPDHTPRRPLLVLRMQHLGALWIVERMRHDLIAKDLVHLLEALALCLGEEEKDDDGAEEVAAHEEDVVLPAEVGEADGADLAEEHHGGVVDDGGDREADRADLHGEDFYGVDPGDWTGGRRG